MAREPVGMQAVQRERISVPLFRVLGIALVLIVASGFSFLAHQTLQNLRDRVEDGVRAQLRGQADVLATSTLAVLQENVLPFAGAAQLFETYRIGLPAFRSMSEDLLDDYPIVSHLSVARELLIVGIVPAFAGREIVGTSYNDLPDQLDSILMAQDTSEIVLTGPVMLAQGWRAMAARIPLYNSATGTHFTVSVILRIDELLDEVTRDIDHETVAIAISREYTSQEVLLRDAGIEPEESLTVKSSFTAFSSDWNVIIASKLNNAVTMTVSLLRFVAPLTFFLIFFAGSFIVETVLRRLRSMAETKEAQQALQDILFGTNVGTWEWNPITGWARYNDRWAEMVGYRLNELGTGAQRSGFQIWQELCHPDDRPELDEARAAIQSGASDTLSRTYRVRKNDGGWLWVQDRGRVVSWDETGIPLLVAGTRTDVHQQKMDQIALKESDQALREKVLQLTEANEHKTRFLATMSHELRTPLNAIIGYSDLLSLNLEENLSKRQLEYVGSISSSGTFLFELISDLLDLSALDAGGIQADVSKFSLVRLVPDVLSVFTQQVLSRDITVTVSGVEAIPDLYTDRRRLMQVLVNLVSNAVKYNRDGGSISIRAVHQGPRIVIDVEDTGAGIPEQEQDRVFDMFQRAAQNPKIAKPGTGIGLALARRIMESLGGTITLRSVVDEGTIFTLTLPIRWVDPRASTDDNMMHDPSIQPQLPLKIESDLR